MNIQPGDHVLHPSLGKGIFIEHKDCGEAGVVFCADDGVSIVDEDVLSLQLPVVNAIHKAYDDAVRAEREAVAALAQVIYAARLRSEHREDTIGVLLKLGVFHHLSDRREKIVALAELIDEVKVV